MILLNTLHEVYEYMGRNKAPQIKITVTKYLFEQLQARDFKFEIIDKTCTGQKTILLSSFQ
jgi:hypothetical protein